MNVLEEENIPDRELDIDRLKIERENEIYLPLP